MQGMCNMCYDSPYAMLCDKIVKESHVEIENEGQNNNTTSFTLSTTHTRHSLNAYSI